MEVGISWVFPENFSHLVSTWRLPKSSKMEKGLWRLILPSICWPIWLERNQEIFKNYSEPSFKVFNKAIDKWSFWASSCKELNGCSFVDITKEWSKMIRDSCM